MSTFNDIDIECSQCGEKFRGTIWVAIHAGQDPELKDLLLGGELNLVSCPECGQVTFQEHFLLYQEPAAELVAYVYTESQEAQKEELEKLMLAGFRDAQKTLSEKKQITYEPMLLFGLETLIELLRSEEALAEQSQIAQAICKEHKVDAEFLRPSHARRLHTMRVLPRVGKSHPASRGDILAGLDRLLALNPALDLYAKLKESIQANPAWRF